VPFKKGQSGNTKGRPKKGLAAMDDLTRAIARCEKKEERLPLMEHYVDRAYNNDGLLIALMKKILPDLKQTEIDATISADVNLRLKKLPDSLMEMITRDKD
jgi:hypothetical protein